MPAISNELTTSQQAYVPDETAEINAFLKHVQSRAFAMAKAALGNREDALDVVQDTMMQLVRHYSDRTADEWRMLFYRILHNRINDFFRRRKVRDKVRGWLPGSFRATDETVEEDPFQAVPGDYTDQPDVNLQRQRLVGQIQAALGTLPRRQREAFLLRCWEGLSTAQTAATMQCSEGSVKTHYSRAMASLRIHLEELKP